MAFQRPSGAPPSGGWSPYRAPRRPEDGRFPRRGVVVAAVAALLVVTGGVAAALLLRGGAPAPASGLGGRFAALSDTTVRRCPPDGTALAAFTTCVGRYRDGLERLHVPSSAQAGEHNVSNIVQLLQTCSATPDHDDPTMRDWAAGCPQQGPSTVADAQAQDEQFRSQYYGILLAADDALRAQLGAPAVAATP